MEFEDTSFVFSHSWPSCAFAFKLLDYKELFTAVEWDTRLEKAEFESTSVGSLFPNLTYCKLNLVHSTQSFFFIQGSTDYVRKILEVVVDKYYWLICAGVVEDMGRSVKPEEVICFECLYWK